jgi:peptidoglycan/xylan/chitin deacetylase (PgdA/CDA1 family)
VKAVLTYHSIDDSGSPISIPERIFRRHVEWLATHGPPVVTMDELLRLPHDAPAVAITFDDAFVNFAQTAWPVLRDHRVPVTLYVPTDHVGGTNAWGGSTDAGIPTLPIMDWDAVARIAAEGVTIGSHTCTHPHLPRLPHARMVAELEGSAVRIESMIGERPAGLAYPYGAYDEHTVRAAVSTYEHACTTELRLLNTDDEPHRLPRLDMYYMQADGMMEAWGTARLRMYLRARASARSCRELLMSVSNR